MHESSDEPNNPVHQMPAAVALFYLPWCSQKFMDFPVSTDHCEALDPTGVLSIISACPMLTMLAHLH